MKKTKQIIMLFFVFMFLITTTSCSNKTTNENPTILDFYNFSNDDLKELNGKPVIVYGYYLLNPYQNGIAYIAEAPMRAIVNNYETSENEQGYMSFNMQDNGVIAVYFEEEPEYTSRPIKITGTLKKGNFTDGYYFSYEYIIENASVELVPPKVSPKEGFGYK